MFPVKCIKCLEPECINVRLDDLTLFHCRECDEDFEASEITEFLAGWQAVLAWTATAENFKPAP